MNFFSTTLKQPANLDNNFVYGSVFIRNIIFELINVQFALCLCLRSNFP